VEDDGEHRAAAGVVEQPHVDEVIANVISPTGASCPAVTSGRCLERRGRARVSPRAATGRSAAGRATPASRVPRRSARRAGRRAQRGEQQNLDQGSCVRTGAGAPRGRRSRTSRRPAPPAACRWPPPTRPSRPPAQQPRTPGPVAASALRDADDDDRGDQRSAPEERRGRVPPGRRAATRRRRRRARRRRRGGACASMRRSDAGDREVGGAGDVRCPRVPR
jgi:hypothetical protein